MDIMKSIKMAAVSIALACLAAGCGKGWEQTKKNFSSSFGSLNRRVVVYDSLARTNLWEFTGEVWVDEMSTPGDVCIIWTDPDTGRNYKNDYLGRHISVAIQEVPVPGK